MSLCQKCVRCLVDNLCPKVSFSYVDLTGRECKRDNNMWKISEECVRDAREAGYGSVTVSLRVCLPICIPTRDRAREFKPYTTFYTKAR